MLITRSEEYLGAGVLGRGDPSSNGVGRRSFKPSSNVIPRNKVPQGRHEIRPHVLILQVVGVFPGVKDQERE